MQDPLQEVCGGSFEALDRHAELAREAMLLEGNGIVDYSIGDEGFVDSACNLLDQPLACAESTGRIFTSSLLDQHEVVHAVRFLDPELSVRSSAIEEGLSTLFGADDLGSGIHPLDPMGILAEPRVGGREEYFRAGHTLANLFERHGVGAFRDFDVSSSSVQEDLAFVEAFGESKEEFALALDGEPVCEQSQWWIPLLECDGEPMAMDPASGELTLTGDLNCGAPDVVGPQHGRMWTSRHFRLVRRTSELEYDFDMPEEATLEIVGCEGGCPERPVYIGGINDVGSVLDGLPALEPGEYFLRMSRPVAGGEGHFEITLL